VEFTKSISGARPHPNPGNHIGGLGLEGVGKTVASHTSEEFVAFLAAMAASRPPQEEIHIILDNLSAHKTKRVGEFLSLHPNVRLHFTPTYSSWLNQVELWLSKIERDVIARDIFTSTSDMTRNSCATSASTTRRPSPSSGSTSM
jgi:transposase